MSTWEEAYDAPETTSKKELPAWAENTARKIGIGAKGFASGALGTPGDIMQLANEIAGKKNPLKALVLPQWELPTSEQVGKGVEKISSRDITPKTTGEKILEGGGYGLGSILGLGGPLKAATPAKAAFRNIMGAFAPASVSVATEKANLPPWMQAASTLGTAFLTHRLTGKSLKEMQRELYQQAEQALPANAKVNGKDFSKYISSLKGKIEKGAGATTERETVKMLDKLLGKVKNGKIGIDELIASRRSFTEEALKDEFKKSPRARQLLKSAIWEMDYEIDKYSFLNPEFHEAYRDANSLTKGLAESHAVVDYIKRNLAKAGGTELLLHYISPFLAKSAFPAAQTGAFATALARNPGFRKAYWNVLKNASKEEFKGTRDALKVFEKKAKELGLDEISSDDQWNMAYHSEEK